MFLIKLFIFIVINFIMLFHSIDLKTIKTNITQNIHNSHPLKNHGRKIWLVYFKKEVFILCVTQEVSKL